MMLVSVAVAALSYAAPSSIPTIPIAPGVYMPLAGLGTWQYNSSVAYAASLSALRLGYTHIDTALGYKNQDGVGAALRDFLKTGSKANGRPPRREDIFITSKIPGGFSEDEAAATLATSLEQLFPGDADGYVDLMLVHFPATWEGEGGKAKRQAEWRALQAFAKAGKARSIGVSHYCRRHLDDVLELGGTPPALNQVQFHVGMGGAGPNATDDRAYHAKVGVAYMGFSPLCGPCDGKDGTELISGELVTSIGAKYGKTGAQVALKWQTQQGIPVVPKSANPVHQAQNIDLFDWELSATDMAALDAATSPPVAGDKGPSGYVSGDCAVP